MKGELMKKASKSKTLYESDPDMLEEYDFSKGVRGKYVNRFAEGSNVVILSPDVANIFPDSDSVNEALRMLAKIAYKQVVKTGT
jgi:hypothetical protein